MQDLEAVKIIEKIQEEISDAQVALRKSLRALDSSKKELDAIVEKIG